MASTLLLSQSALSLPRLPTRLSYRHTPLQPHLGLATPPRAGPIIASADGSSWATFAILTCAAATGRRLGTVPVGRTLSGPICSMGLTFAGACSGVLPPVALNGVARSTQINAVRLATPLLLFNADLRKVYRSAAGCFRPSRSVRSRRWRARSWAPGSARAARRGLWRRRPQGRRRARGENIGGGVSSRSRRRSASVSPPSPPRSPSTT